MSAVHEQVFLDASEFHDGFLSSSGAESTRQPFVAYSTPFPIETTIPPSALFWIHSRNFPLAGLFRIYESAKIYGNDDKLALHATSPFQRHASAPFSRSHLA